MQVAHRVVTANTTRLRIINLGVRAFNGLYYFLVTLPAGLFGYRTTTRRDVNVVFKPTGREIVRVPETITRFGHVFGRQARWRVAIVAYGNRAMARLQPAAKLVLHHMTIHTLRGRRSCTNNRARRQTCTRPHRMRFQSPRPELHPVPNAALETQISFLYSFVLFVALRGYLIVQKRHRVPVWQRLQTEKSSPPKARLPLWQLIQLNDCSLA